MKQASRRLFAVLCAFCMLFVSMPVSAYTDLTPATPTDLAPVEEPAEQEIPEAAEPEETQESGGPVEAAEDPEPAPETPAEEPADPGAAAELEETNEPEIIKPEADREVTGSDDITVSGSLEGNPPADYLIRYTPEKDQTLCLILATNGDLKASVTDENTGAAKQFIFDHTDEDGQNVLTLPYYKVNQDSTYLIRLSGNKPAEFAIRMVKMSILKAEEESALTPEEEPAESPEETQPEPESGTQSEPETETQPEPGTEPQAEPEIPDQPEKPASEPEQETTEPDPAEQAEPAGKEITEPEAQNTPATQTDLEPEAEPVKEEPVEIRIEATDSPVEANIVFMSDAGIPPDAVLQVRELTEAEQAAYQARTIRALKCENEAYLYYTRYLAFTLLHNGEAVDLNAPATVSVTLADVSEGIDALQVVRFGRIGAKLLDSERAGDTISFRTNSLAVFGIGNALTPLDIQETELVSVEVLSFSPDAEVSLKETKAPEVEEGLEVLGTFRVEDQTKADGTAGQDDLWIKAELNGDADLPPMESVSLYRVEDGQAEMMVEDLSQNSDITELDAQQVAVIRDTGYRHLTLTVSPEDGNESKTVTLDGMMPKDAEAAIIDVTEQYTEPDPGDGEADDVQVEQPEDAQAEQGAEAEAGQAEETAEEQPEDAETEQTAEAETETETDGTRTTIAAYDISISHADGEYQPDEDKPISVEIRDNRISAEANIELWHIRDDGTREQVTEFTVEEGKITFEATGFSVYVVINHEDVTDPADSIVKTPRVMFHFINIDNATEQLEGTGVYYIAKPYQFKNKNGEIQTTQILKDTESLELIVDPGNRATQFFYGWYMVQPHPTDSADETDIEGIATNGDLYFTWPANPKQIIFNSPISIPEKDVAINATVNWTLNGVSGSGAVDSEGNVHVFLAPIFENYNFVDFMLYPRDESSTGSGEEQDPNANNLMTRKMIVRGSAEELEVKVSDIRSNSTDPVYLIFTGWEYNNGTEWMQIPTVDYSGAELKDKIPDGQGGYTERDGTYLDLDSTLIQGDSNLALYPIFIEARWMDFSSGISGSGATYVASRFLESWGASTPPNTPKVDGKNVISSLDVPTREGYEFMGWYAYADVDEHTGNITNLETTAAIETKYINLDSKFNTINATINTTAIQITDGNGDVVDHLDTVTLNNGTVELFGITDGQLQFFDALDRMKLTARWRPSESQIHVIYWTEKAQEKGYTAPENPKDDYIPSAVKTIKTEELNTYLESTGSETRYYSGYSITREGLAVYKDGTVGILETQYLDDLNAVPEGDEKFYTLDTTLSDADVVIKGDGSTVMNVYYSRLDFTLVFHIGRDGYVKQNGQQKKGMTTNWDGNWIQYMYFDEKTEALGYSRGNNGTSYPERGTASQDFVFSMTYKPTGETYTSWYVTTKANVKGDYNPKDHGDTNLYWINAKYGAYIGNRWPSPVNTENFTFTDPKGSSRTMYIWAGYYGSLYCGMSHDRDPAGDANNCNPDINGIYEYMSAELCSNRDGTDIINANRVHHLVAYFGQSGKEGLIKNYHYYFEVIPGVQIPAGTELPVHGTDYLGYPQTTWSSLKGDADQIDGYDFYKKADATVISERSPQVQIGPEFDGYDFLYSCYEVPDTYDYHIYFFYRPKQYMLTLMFDDKEERHTASYYYGQTLADALKYDGYTEPSKEGYYFAGWYLNKEGLGEPFDFASETMPNAAVVLYPVLKVLEYTVKIDPNGGVIDHADNDSQSTYFNAKYGTPVGEYTISRTFIKLSSKEQDPDDSIYYNPETPGHDWYYYVNVQRLNPNPDGTPGPDGDWGYPADVRSALYLTKDGLEDFYDQYCDAVDGADPTWWTHIRKLSFNEFKDTFCDYPYRPVDGERYTFMGWYQVRNGVVDTMPYNFNDPVTGDLELRAKWRLEGGYFLQYNPYYLTNEGELIVGELSQWTDPINPSEQLYADQSLTHILRAPTPETVNEGYVFRGWHIVKKSDRPAVHNNDNGKDYYYWDAIEEDENGQIIYYQPGDPFIVDSKYVTEVQSGRTGSIIHLQAYYEPEDTSARRPERANLTLDATDGFITYENGTEVTENKSLDMLGDVGTVVLNVSGGKEEVVFGNIQSNISVHLMEYADIPNYFRHPLGFFLLGFDEAPDVDYVATYPADAVIAVQRTDEKTLYAVWEKMVYVTFVNDTDQPITVSIEGTGNTTASIVNKSTGKFDRESITKVFDVPANSDVKIVLPGANTDQNDSFTATVINTHYRKKMNVKGSFRGAVYGTASDPVYYGGTLTYTGVLQIDENGIVVTYEEEDVPEVLFNVNGGRWEDQPSPDYYQKRTEGIYALPADKIEDNQYRPVNDPTNADKIFVGWTDNADIAAQTDFSATDTVIWGETTITPAEGSNVLEEVRSRFLWDFRKPAPTGDGANILYAVWSDTVTVIFDLTKTGSKLHNWTGPTTTEEPGNYVFYRPAGSSTVTYTLKRGEKLPIIPDDPTCNREAQWYFLNWLRVDLYMNSPKGQSTVSQYAFDFDTPINYNTPLYTSWAEKKNIQTYVFSIQNNVPDPGDQQKDFTYTIAAENVKRKSGNSSVDPDAFGSVSTQLKHGDTYTVRITITKDPDNGMHDVYAEVTDRTGDVIKQGHLLTYQNDDGATDYKYTIRVTQAPEEGYCTNVSMDEAGTAILTNLHDQFTFYSSTGNTYKPNENAFSNANNRNKNATVIFTNWRKEDLTLTKHVQYDMGDRGRDFTFTLTSVEGDSDGTAEYKYSKAGTSTEEGWLKTGDTFTLKHEESITIQVPYDKAAVITEDNTNYSTSWSTSGTTATLDNDDTAAATITLTGDADVTVTNTRGTRAVTVKKLVDTENTSQSFSFTAQLSDGSVPIANYTVYTDSSNSSDNNITDSDGNATFHLRHNEMQTLTIPDGAKLVVTEGVSVGYSPSVAMVDSNDEPIENDVEAAASFTKNSVTQNGTITFTNTEDVRNVLLFDTNNGTWTETSDKFETLSETLYQIPEDNISGTDYQPSDPTRTDKIFIGWTEYKDIADETDFSGSSMEMPSGETIIADAGGIVLDKIRSDYLWDFSRPPANEDYGKTLYAVWSDTVTVTFDLKKSGSSYHSWCTNNLGTEAIPYTFYRDDTGRYVYYQMLPHETVPIPNNPTTNDSSWGFLGWVTTSNYTGSPTDPRNVDNILYDFSTAVTSSDLILYTSWSKNKPQYYMFKVLNQVTGNSDEEFTYTIEISEELVRGKINNSKDNDIGAPNTKWGNLTTTLKNGEDYTVLITIQKMTSGWTAFSIHMDAMDHNGTVIKSGPIVYCSYNSEQYFVTDYKYKLTISQEAKAGYTTTVDMTDQDGSITDDDTDPTSLSYTFVSCFGATSNLSGFESYVNGYAPGTNSVLITFNNSTDEEEVIPAPTAYSSRHIPFFLMLAAGLILMIVLGGMRIRRRREEEPDGEETLSVNTIIPDTGPPGSGTSRETLDRTGNRSNTDCEKDPMKGDLNQ